MHRLILGSESLLPRAKEKVVKTFLYSKLMLDYDRHKGLNRSL